MHFDTLFSLRRPALAGSMALLLGGLLLGSCQEDDPDGLEGPVPTAAFSTQLNTAQYPVEVTFTSSSQDDFLEQWNFGDGSALETHRAGEVVKHTYTRAGAYQVKLTAAGRGGTAVSPVQTVTIPSLCGDATFNALTKCSGSTGSASWRLSDQPGAIKRLSASGTVLSSSAAPLDACLTDDEFSFANTYSYSYNAGAGTYSGGTCGPARTANSGFVYKTGSGSVLGQIILQGKGAFIGTADSVVNKTYNIVEASATILRLQGTNPDGTKTEVTLLPQLSALELIKLQLTGTTSRTWILDNRKAAAIIVGENDASPGGYYGGGAAGALPPCQADDEFTFSAANVYTYNAKTETFVAGGVGCQAPLSGTSNFTFGAVSGGAGVAQFELSRPGAFIGVTDAPDLLYRIISINDSLMVLRAGRNKPTGAGGIVFTMKMRVK
ncbi:PKD domain-containing protein [Hymenobacter jeollabukensis]|uniref:PKD domain-containing protein n=1 Tax=Hymenobacter jeollabukensis TaxID=2025313 RepID=A0A5R8WY92_9BACT|nr:PKD domain-containing protein [Hymenobacter jeollabukensis]TLM97134.1 PKD domain-containing protein [Hymenobacter jeollabukensis]